MKPDDTIYLGTRIIDEANVLRIVVMVGPTFLPLSDRDARAVGRLKVGFAFGGCSTGAMQLALGILLDFFQGEELAAAMALHFRGEFGIDIVEKWPASGFTLYGLEIKGWLDRANTRRPFAKGR